MQRREDDAEVDGPPASSSSSRACAALESRNDIPICSSIVNLQCTSFTRFAISQHTSRIASFAAWVPNSLEQHFVRSHALVSRSERLIWRISGFMNTT